MKPNATLPGRGQHLLGAIHRVRRLTVLWIALPMFGNGATIGLGQTIITRPHLVTLKVLIAASITWSVAARGIGDNGARTACGLPPVFGTISRVIHSAFVWFGNPIGESLIYIRAAQLHLTLTDCKSPQDS